MFQRKTSDLEKLLEETQPKNIDLFMEEHAEELLTDQREFMNYINEKLKEKKLLKQDVLLKADISQGYGYKLLSEEKVTRQRDVILRICYAAEFTLEETQRALRIYHMDTLYAREPRDLLLMNCFMKRPGSILDVNELLMKNKMPPLRTSGVQE